MISVVTLLSLNAYGARYTVSGSNSLQNALNSACINNVGPHEIVFDVDPRDTYNLGPGSIDGDVVTYPPIGCANENNPPAITIRSEGVPATIKYQVQATPQHATLFTFRNGADVTMENLIVEGVLLLDFANEDPLLAGEAPLGPDCAIGGAYVRGVQTSGTPARTGSLTVDGVAFRCLDADDEDSGVAGLNNRNGGGILSFGVPLDISDSSFYANSGTSGGAIALFSGNTSTLPDEDELVLNNVVFQNNESLFGGAVLFDWAGKSAVVDFGTFQGNEGQFGSGALDFRDMDEVSIRRSVFDRQNPFGFQEEQIGGAVRVERTSSLVFENNLVCGSWAGEGGGVYASDVSNLNIEGNVFAENGALFYGGGVTVRRTQLAEGEQVARVVNNTFVGNEAGRPPEFLNSDIIYSLGGGGAAAFFGVNPEFRNNVVAQSPFGGGVLGDYVPFTGPPGFQIGDELVFFNNLFHNNDDAVNGIESHLTGEFGSLAFHPSNILNEDPLLAYTALGEFNCVPDTFFPLIDSPLVDAGGGPAVDGLPGQCADFVDTDAVPDFEQDTALPGQCDIGAFGGEKGLFLKDTDGDGFANIFDCDDNFNGTNPGAVDICDFRDNDCNGIVDDNLEVEWYVDADQDGYGDRDAPKVISCTPVAGRVANNGDCDDAAATTNVDAPELCDGIDNNCNDEIDDGLTFSQFYTDNDGDGFGSDSSVREDCQLPEGAVAQGGDCNDNDIAISPSALEFCGDQIDNDCDTLTDAADESASPRSVFFSDNDQDGFGNDETSIAVCGEGAEVPEGLAGTGGDCNDSAPGINPGAQESCSIPGDEDCDGVENEIDANTIDATAYFPDADADGVGADINPTYVCEDGETFPPPGFVQRAGDCDDNDNLVQECSQCGCQASPSAAQGALGVFVGLLGVLARRRR